MSIPNILNKIKGQVTIDTTTIMYLCIIILVGISSFGLGRLSVQNFSSDDKGIVIKGSSPNISPEIKESSPYTTLNSVNINPHNYVASKNGKLYYSAECSGAKRIKPENQVWFESSIDAEKSGYQLSKSCK